MQRRKPSKIPFLRCAACVRRYFRSIKALPDNRAYRYEAFHQWPHGDNPGYLPDGPLRKHTVFFCGRKTDRLKALYHDKNGFVLLYMRLDSGRFQWPRCASEARMLTRQEYRWLMEGLSIDQPQNRIFSGNLSTDSRLRVVSCG